MHSFVTSKNVKWPRFLAHPVYRIYSPRWLFWWSSNAWT